MFLLVLLIALASLLILYRKSKEDLKHNQKYLYITGTILAVSTGSALTIVLDNPLYQNRWFVGILVVFFVFFVMIPGILMKLRELYLHGGKLKHAARIQKAIPYFVWSELEQSRRQLLQTASTIQDRSPEEALKELRRQNSEQFPEILRKEHSELQILVLGMMGNWEAVLQEYQNIKRYSFLHIPVIIQVAKSYAEVGELRSARQILTELTQRPLPKRQKFGVIAVRMCIEMIQGNVEEGKELLALLVQNDPNISSSFELYWRGRGMAASGNLEKARILLEEAEKNLGPIKQQNRNLQKLIQHEKDSVKYQLEKQKEEWKEMSPREISVIEDYESSPYEGKSLDEAFPGSFGLGELKEKTTSFFSKEAREIKRFIDKIQQFPVYSTALIVLLSVIWCITFGLQLVGQINNDSRTAQYKVQFLLGMKVDFLIDQQRNPRTGPPKKTLKQEVNLHQVSKLMNAPLRTVARSGEQRYYVLHKNEDGTLEMWEYFEGGNESKKLFSTDIHSSNTTYFDRKNNIWYAQSGDGSWSKWMLPSGKKISNPSITPEALDSLAPQTAKNQYWRLLTATMLHLGWIHIFFNCVALWFLGRIVENLYEIRDFLSIYLFSGITGSIASWQFAPHQLSAGASGAIFGLAGCILAVVYFHPSGIPEQIRKRLGNILLFLVILNLLFGEAAGGIDNAGHLGGLVGGFLISLFVAPTQDNDSSKQQSILHGSFIRWTIFFSFLIVYLVAIGQCFQFIFEFYPILF